MNCTVFIIDDDPSIRDALGLLLGLRGYRTAIFADAKTFLDAFRDDWRGCLLIDIRMPGMDGLELQKRLKTIGSVIPVVIITGHGDVTSARDAFRNEAVDFLEKPLDEVRLLNAINDAYARQTIVQEQSDQKRRYKQLISELTPREHQVMELVIAGRHNRDIAQDLGISVRTVEVHKARMMAKLKADGIPQLVRISLGLTDSQ